MINDIRLTSLERMRYLTKRPLNTASVWESNSLAGVTVVVPAENKSQGAIDSIKLITLLNYLRSALL